MPKLKTHSGAKKRFRPRGEGFKYRKASRNHILTKKSHKRKLHLRKQGSVVKVDQRAIQRLLTGS